MAVRGPATFCVCDQVPCKLQHRVLVYVEVADVAECLPESHEIETRSPRRGVKGGGGRGLRKGDEKGEGGLVSHVFRPTILNT